MPGIALTARHHARRRTHDLRARPIGEPPVPINKELLEILVCPVSHAPLVQDDDTLVSTDKETRRRYRIEDGIPNMLVEESEELDEAIWTAIMKKHGKA